MEYSKILLFVGIITIGMVIESHGHSYVTSPQSRSNQRQTQSGCRGPACLGPCDTPLANSKGPVATYQRGDKVTVQWPRNNHAGGFIRFAWALTSNSDSASAFDTGVQQINCHEVGGCGPSNPSDPNGGDDGAGDGSYKPCQSTITVPGNLADGKWTLQWAWFGGAFALGDYYSCIDVTISGGSYATFSPVFVGGDYANPGTQKCKFFNTNKLHQCVNEPCNNPSFSGQQTGVPAYLQINLDGSIIPVTIGANVSTPSPAPAPKPATSTSSSTSSKPPTQSSTSTSTSGSVRPSTSTSSTSASVPVPATPSTPSTPSNPSSSNSCSAGQMKCVDSEQFAMCLYGSWGSPMRCAPSTTCRPFGDVIQCGW